jgi:predicted DNA-binding protein
MRNQRTEQNKQISVRLSARDHERLVREAEKLGTTIAEVAREHIKAAEKQAEIKDYFTSLLKHVTKNIFVITSEVADLTEQEKCVVQKKAEKLLGRKI